MTAPVAETAAANTEAPGAPVVTAPAVSAPVVEAPSAVAAPAAVMPPAAPTTPAAHAAVATTPVTTLAGLPSVSSYTLQIDSLHQVAQGSGLVWVNSDEGKVAAVQAAISAEPKPVRVPRERPAAVVLNEGPLVLVETRKDLKDMNLPF